MKSLICGLFVSLFSFSVYATVDAMTEGWIVVQNIQEESDFGVQKVPIIGCYGIPQGPQLEQFVADFQVKATVGCGGGSNFGTVDINALSCATILDSKENSDYMSFKSITLDISACPYKDNKRFITMVRTAAARNFPQTLKGKIIKNKEVELILKK